MRSRTILLLALLAASPLSAQTSRRVAVTPAPAPEPPDPTGPAGPAREDYVPGIACAPALEDQGMPGGVLRAATVPVLGRLLPLSTSLFVAPNGWVALDATDAESRLFVASGSVRVDDDALEVRGSDAGAPLTLLSATPGPRLSNAASSFDAESSPSPNVQLRGGTIQLYASDSARGPNAEVVGAHRSIYQADGPDGAEIAVSALGQGHRFQASAQGSGAGRWWMGFDAVEDAVVLEGGDATSSGAFRVLDPDGSPELEIQASDFVEGDGGASLTIHADQGTAAAQLLATEDGGVLTLHDDGGDVRLRASGKVAPGGAQLTLFNGGDVETVSLWGEGTLTGESEVILRDVNADEGFLASDGTVQLSRRLGGTAVPGAVLEKPGTMGIAEGLTLLSSSGGNPVFLGARGNLMTAGGKLEVMGTAVSPSPPFTVENNQLILRDASGSATIFNDSVAGTKSAVAHTDSFGARLFFCSEGARAMFEDAGRGRLEEGSAEVVLDPVFLQTVVIDDDHPYLVEVTPRGASTGLWVEKHADRFLVHELEGGPGDAAFDWRVQASRVGLADARLERICPERP